MPSIKQLYDLQTVDLELDARSRRLADIAVRLGDESELMPLRAAATSSAKAVDEAASGQAELDLAITGFTAKIEAAEAKLYGGKVTLVRELQDLQADVDMIKRQRGDQEDKLLVMLERSELAQASLDKAAGILASAESSWQTDQASMAEEQKVLKTEVAEFQAERDKRAGGVPAPDLTTYEKVRKQHAGRAVARMRNDTCESCRVGLPNREVHSVKTSATPVRCPSCGLILLAD
jgi:predicted  nucleic acid-binding Zn-ribbon protein